MINRKTFIKRAMLSLTSLFIPAAKHKEGERKEIFLTKFYIAGFQYYDGNKVLDSLKENDELIIKHEPENIYDHRALEVYTVKDKKLGYVPRRENPVPSRLLRQNVELKAVIEKINHDEGDFRKVGARLYMVV